MACYRRPNMVELLRKGQLGQQGQRKHPTDRAFFSARCALDFEQRLLLLLGRPGISTSLLFLNSAQT